MATDENKIPPGTSDVEHLELIMEWAMDALRITQPHACVNKSGKKGKIRVPQIF